MHPGLKKMHITHKINTHRKPIPGLVAVYDIQSRNGVGVFWWNGKGRKRKKIDEASKKGKRDIY